MGIFSKKEERKTTIIPSLPELPKLPSDFNDFGDLSRSEELHELPSFPNNSIGDKFSRDTIKNAVVGNDYETDDEVLLPKFPSKGIPKVENSKRSPLQFKPREFSPKHFEEDFPKEEKGPVFVRIDHFEEALEIFKKTKDEIENIEELFEDIKELKEKEDSEISKWEIELQNIKNQMEKVNANLFSKI